MDNSSSLATKPTPSTSTNSNENTGNSSNTSNGSTHPSSSSSASTLSGGGGGGGEYSLGGVGSTSVDHHGLNESHGQHQIVTTVTTNRQSTSNASGYGGNLSSLNNANGNLSGGNSSSSSNSYKLKQQRNYQNNRFDPMGGQTGGGGGGGGGGYQARNAAANAAAAAAAAAAAQLHHPWSNPNVLSGQTSSPYPTNLSANAFALPHHYSQQTVDMYTNYYGTTGASPYATHPSQHSAYGQYGQSLIPQESPKGGHVIYVYGIGQKATQEEIFALFQPFGRVLRVDIIIDFNTGLCKGYAFVAMEQYQDAQMAIQSLNAAPFHGRQLQVRFKS